MLALSFVIHSVRAPDASSVSAATNIGGSITSDTTWTEANSPYIVTSNVLVSQGVKLTIEPGVTARFNDGLSLRIDGTLIARGNSSNIIIFTSNNSPPGAGDWGNIFFTGTSVDATFDDAGEYTGGCILEKVIAEYGGGGDTKGIIEVDSSSPLIKDSVIWKSSHSGIYASSAKPKIVNNTIYDNSFYGIYVSQWGYYVDIWNNTISNNLQDGIYVVRASGNITNNMIENNKGSGVRLTGDTGGNVVVSGNVIRNNLQWGVYADNGDYTITRNLVFLNKAGGIFMNSGRKVVNNIVADNLGRGFSSYHAAPPLRNNVFVRNKGDYAVYYAPYSGAMNVDNNTITQNEGTLGTVYLHAWTTGPYVGYPLFNHNNIFDNTAPYEVLNDYTSGTTINAEDNWWGTSNETEISAKIYDWFDKSTIGLIDYSPYRPSAITDIPISPPTDLTVSVEAMNFTLRWNRTPEPDLAGYKIYYDTDSGYPYRYSIDVGNVTTYTLTGLPSNVNYFTVTAYDVEADGSDDLFEGHESWYASEVAADTVPPIGSILINEGATYTTMPSVTLTLSATDAVSGVAEMRFSDDNITWTPWGAYATSKSWTLPTGDGTKTVYVQFKDNVGLISQSYSDTIILDIVPPLGSIAIAEGAAYTNSLSVTLTLSANDITSGVAQMRFSNDNVTWSDWESYTTSKQWTLPTGDGVKGVTVQYKDNAGLISSYSDLIILDTTKPTANAGTDRTVNEDTLITLDGSASSDNLAITAYTWTFTDVAVKTLTGEKPTYTFNTPGVYTITLNVTDAAGNWATDTVIITVFDITKPTANAGQDQTVKVGETVTFDASGSSDNVGIVSYEWDFGDGTKATGKTTTHTYTSQGTCTVTLTDKDAAGNTGTDTVIVTVLGIPINAVAGSPSNIDGVIAPGEWNDASTVSFNNTVAYVKQDGRNLYVAFNVSDNTVNLDPGEGPKDGVAIFIDVENNRGTSPQPDDIAFYILRNGQLLERQGDNPPTPPTSGWIGSASSTSNQWQAEFNITYAKIAITSGEAKTLGIAFMSLDYATGYPYFWPPMTPMQSNNPSNWGNLISEEAWIAPPPPSAEAFPMWIVGAVVATIAIAVASTILWKKRK
jgi:PKD repeat protein